MVSSFAPEATTGMPASYSRSVKRHQPQRDVLVVDGVHTGQEDRGHTLDQRQIPRRMHGGQMGAQRVEVVQGRARARAAARAATSSSDSGCGAGGRSRCR